MVLLVLLLVLKLLLLLVLVFFVTLFVVGITTGTRKIPVQYAKRVIGNKQYGGVRQFIPLKVNEDMVGFKFGEFSSTRRTATHKNKKKNKK